MGKAKYRSVYQSVSMKKGVKKGSKQQRLKVMGCKIPSLLPYNKLMEHVKTVDLGKIGNVTMPSQYPLILTIFHKRNPFPKNNY